MLWLLLERIVIVTIRDMIVYTVVLYRLPYFSHVPMSDYFTFQTTDILVRYRLLQTYNKSYKIV